MHEYYFKIKKGDIEFECSTTDKLTFEQQLSDWINGIVQGKEVPAPNENTESAKTDEKQQESLSNEDKPQRSGFIDVKNLTSINDIQTPDFDAFETVKSPLTEELPPIDGETDFEKTLEEAVQNPKTEVIEKADETSEFEQFVSSYNPQNPTDYLIIAAKYILNIENKERFSLKQINAKLVPFNGSAINHAELQQAIEDGLVRIVHDLTGTSEVTEYTLTTDGEGYFVE